MTMQKQCAALLSAFFLLFIIPLAGQEYLFFCDDDDPLCWEGVYLNGQLGVAGYREDLKFTNPNYFNTLGPVVLGDRFNRKSNGCVEGGALGYNYQNGRYVAGIEAGAFNANLKKSIRSPFFPDTDRFSSQLQCIFNVKGRIGYVCNGMLLFLSGGWAGGHERLKLVDASTPVSAHLKTWMNGWTVGAGFECKLNPCYSMGLGYDFVQLEYKDKAASCPSCGTGVGLGSPKVHERSYVQTLTIRLNYFFY